MIRYVASFPGNPMRPERVEEIQAMWRDALTVRDRRNVIRTAGGKLVRMDKPRVPSNRIRRAQFAASARP